MSKPKYFEPNENIKLWFITMEEQTRDERERIALSDLSDEEKIC